MKVLYIIDQSPEIGKTSGIIHKIKGQISQWKNHNCSVDVLSMYSFVLYNEKFEIINDEKSFCLPKHSRYFTLLRMLISTFKLYSYLKINKYDVVYMRQRPWMPLTKLAFNGQKTIIEINTFDEKEYKVVSKLMYFINKYTRNWFYSIANGFVGVTNELAKGYTDEFKLKSIAIGNGINTKVYQVSFPKNNRPKICFVGSPGFKWHGLEKVLKLANKLLEFDFEIVGLDGENTQNIMFHGYLSLDETKKIVENSDVGLGTLSLYINGLTEASPLKSRQYLAHGLPIIYAYDDTDLDGTEDFTLKIKNTPQNIDDDFEKIKKFVLRVYKNDNLRVEARSFAENVLDVSVKEKKRIDFFEDILKS